LTNNKLKGYEISYILIATDILLLINNELDYIQCICTMWYLQRTNTTWYLDKPILIKSNRTS